MASSQEMITTDHEEIRRWAEERGAKPRACADGDDGDPGILRLDFPGGATQDDLEHIGWDEWFAKFDEQGLAAVLQERKRRARS